MTFCAITPSRGDRPQLLEFCQAQIQRMTTRPYEHFIVDYKPESIHTDLVKRIKTGIELAKAHGHDYAFIMEDDDWYSADYFQMLYQVQNGTEFIGHESTTYYNLFTKQYQTWEHKGRASLFMTGFKISALDGFNWPDDKAPFLDIHLWAYAKEKGKSIHWTKEPNAIGIKHGIGKTGGKGHIITMQKQDPDYRWLRKNVDEEAFRFYLTLERPKQ